MTAPARQFARAGAVLFLVVFAACDRAGAGGDEGPRVLELANDTIQLADGVRLHDVKVARAAGGEFEPARVAAQPGDMLRFTAGDRGGHALSFDGTSGPAREWLDRTAQLRSPPLLDSGSAWVIALEGAPPGDYRIRCTTHGAEAVVTVQPAAP